jgi:hypothetical protein
MEVCGDGATQHRESEKCITSVSSDSGDKIFKYSPGI